MVPIVEKFIYIVLGLLIKQGKTVPDAHMSANVFLTSTIMLEDIRLLQDLHMTAGIFNSIY